MCKLDRRRDSLKEAPYIIVTDGCCKRHVKGWLDRNPMWEQHPTLPKTLRHLKERGTEEAKAN